MTDKDRQRGLELQDYITSIEGMTLEEIAIKYLKKYHLPKLLCYTLVRFAYPLLLGNQYKYEEQITELRARIERMKPYCKSLCKNYSKSVVMGNDCINSTCRNCNKWEMTNG